MAVYEVFSHPVKFKYKSALCSKSTIFLLVTTFLTVILPLLMAYRSHGFWLKSSSYREQPQIRFKYDYILFLETDKPDLPVLCSSFPIAEELNYCTSIKSREDDHNSDGLFDELILEIEVSLPPTTDVFSVQLILVFEYILQKQCLLHMESLGVLQFNSGLPSSRVDIVGDLRLVQKQLLNPRQRDLRYNESIFKLREIPISTLYLTNILKEYGKRNFTTRVENVYSVSARGGLLDEPFIVSVNIAYPEETVQYRPGFWQVIKWAWIQYFSVFTIFLIIFRYVKCYVFTNHLIPAMIEIPWKKYD